MTNPTEFWEKIFAEKQEMWGMEPARSAVLTRDFFAAQGIRTVLIPGAGYGRNARVFSDSGMAVTSIEISGTAVALARKHFGDALTLYHGPVTDMPFDDRRYEGIFCYALIHLLDQAERAKLIRDCYQQLEEGGYMVFTVISKTARTYGQGTYLSPDRYEIFEGVKMFFYDHISIEAEFGAAGLLEITEIEEQFPFFLVRCRKGVGANQG